MYQKSQLEYLEIPTLILAQSGITIGTSDILIAGIAIENGLTLITNNEKHYEPIRGLTIENWKK